MGTARLSNKDPRRDDSNLSNLRAHRKNIKKLLSLQFKDVTVKLPEIIEKFPKRLVPEAYRELERAHNTLKSVLEVPAEIAEEYAEDIKQSRQEIPEHVSNALRELDNKISKLEHTLQIGVRKVVSKEVVDEDTGAVTVSGINSLGDLKSAFDNFLKKSQEVEKKRKKRAEQLIAQQAQPEFSEDEDFSAKALTLVTKFSSYRNRVPKNPDFDQISGVFEAPVMFKGTFNYSNTKNANVEVFNIGSGFFLFEHLPLVYCETGLSEEDAKARVQKVLDQYQKENGIRLVIPDNSRFFRDYGSPNIQFQIAMLPSTFRMLEPFKSIEQAAFPWATTEQKIGAPRSKRSKLDRYIENSKEMMELERRGVELVARERKFSSKIDEIEDKIVAEEKKTVNTKMDAVWRKAGVDNLREDLELAKQKLRQTRSSIRKLRTEKAELTKSLREKYVNRVMNRTKKRKNKR